MITCCKCAKILATIQESSEIHVRGEVKLNVLCSCGEVNYINLFQYDKDRINKG